MSNLPANTVDIYYLDTSTTSIDPRSVEILNEEEHRRYIRYLVDTARTEFLFGRYLLKTVISSYLNVAPREIVFKKNQYGKLFLENRYHHKNICFNLAHSHGIVAGAFVLENDIGIDVEKMDRNILDIAGRFFSPEEKEYINNSHYNVKNSLSYQIWTLKEAYIKAKGVGLSLPLESFSVFDDLGVFFYTARFFIDYCLSVAVYNTGNKRFSFNLYDFNQFISSPLDPYQTRATLP